MTDRSAFDGFEARLAMELERYVAPASDPRSASEVADAAMQPRGLVTRVRNAPRRRRLLLLGLAAALSVPATYLAAGSVRPPTPDRAILVPPAPSGQPAPSGAPSAAPTTASASSVPVFVRRTEGSLDGISIFAVQPDAAEVLVRTLPDSILDIPGTWSAWGSVSESGWIALSVETAGSWPMILVDLGDATSTPWVIPNTNLGGVGPRWGPNGLVAAPGPGGMGTNGLVIVNPTTGSISTMSMQARSLVGGGPSIVWAADGSGIVGAGNGSYDIVPLDGGAPRRGVDEIFDPRGSFGAGLASLRVCWPDAGCADHDDGRVEEVATDGSARTVWKQDGDDRALEAAFGPGTRKYWLSLDHDAGRQVRLVKVRDGQPETVATLNRDPSWGHIAAPIEAPDGRAGLVWVDLGGTSGAVFVPFDGTSPTFHLGHFAGFVNASAAVLPAIGEPVAPARTVPATGQAYALPTVDELVAEELRLNPGRRILGKASHDGVAGDQEIGTVTVTPDERGPIDAYLNCIGPSSVTVTVGATSVTSPCLGAGGYITGSESGSPVTVRASADTSWRVVLYSR
jgi:hypothetical protein